MLDDLQRLHARVMADYRGPTLAYLMSGVLARVRTVTQSAATHGVLCLISVKACPEPRVLAWLMAEGLGLDVSNAGELALVRPLLPQCKFLSLTGPAVETAAAELRALDYAGRLLVNIDSPEQYLRVRDSLPARAELGARIRLTPPRRGGQASCSRFGLDPAHPRSLELLRSDERFVALHVHVGNEDNTHDTYVDMARALAELGARLPRPVRCINLGGGQRHVSVVALERLMAEIRRSCLADTLLVLEPGAFWFERSGYAFCRVLSRRHDALGCRIITDISRECHLRWSSPTLRWAPPKSEPGITERVHLVGPTCYEADMIGSFTVRRTSEGRELAPGACLVLANVSSYAAAWNSAFNGIAKAEVIFDGVDR